MGTTYHDYVENSWEWAVSRIIVHHELEFPMGQHAAYKDLFRKGMYTVLARAAWDDIRRAGIEWEGSDMIELLAGKQHDYGPVSYTHNLHSTATPRTVDTHGTPCHGKGHRQT